MKKMIAIFGVAATVACSPSFENSIATAPQHIEAADLSSVLMDNSSGCMEGPTAQFGRYVGDWDIQDWTLSRDDGVTWLDGKGARWNFVCVGNGLAIQDFWMPTGGGVGTNVRIYNAESKNWDIVWTATNAPGTSNIHAVLQESGEIHMSILSPKPNPPRRIIFYPPTEEGWNWAMQMDVNSDRNWTTVYKMKATRR